MTDLFTQELQMANERHRERMTKALCVLLEEHKGQAKQLADTGATHYQFQVSSRFAGVSKLVLDQVKE